MSSRALALERVKRLLLQKLGTYPESETDVKHFCQLTGLVFALKHDVALNLKAPDGCSKSPGAFTFDPSGKPIS